MIELLRDPAWNGIAGIAAIIALIVAIWQEKRVIKILPRTLIVTGRALIGILIIMFGPFIQWSIQELFVGGVPLIVELWKSQSINTFALFSFIYAIFPGTVTATISSSKNKNTILRTIIAAIISATIIDIVIIVIQNWGVGSDWIVPPFFYSLLSNLAGGIIAGVIINYLVRQYDKVFEIV